MNTKTMHGQMTIIDENGNLTKLHQETSANDVLVDRSTNNQGLNNTSAIPLDVTTVQNLTNKLGGLAFKNIVNSEDLEDDIIIFDETSEDISLPESEINDGITSDSLTWSSSKINAHINEIIDRVEDINNNSNNIFYVALVENANGTFTAQKTVAQIESAYQLNKAIWIISSGILLPLRKRQDANTWIFSGYTETQAYDITVTANAVTFTYHELVTKNDTLPNPSALRLTGAVQATYDGTEEVEVEITEMIPASSTTDGVGGLVPAPKAGEQNHILYGDGTWHSISQTTGENSDAIMSQAAVTTEINTITNELSTLNTYIDTLFTELNINYEDLAFDTEDIIIGTANTNTSSILGRAILGQMVLA